jgi:serine phosphatase RsbU (regulator of sigma subunit)
VDVQGYSPTWASDFAAIRLTAPVPLAEAARTRRPVWLSDRTALLARYPDLAPFLHARTEATASLPLVVGDRVVGALGLVFRQPRGFGAAERTFLLTVAQQVAAALERAALADVRREMADTLQRSLLPARLPATERVAVTARYLPAVEGTLAGGDWYDAAMIAEDCLALVVGDVVGHGAAAAAVMGRLSSALSALLMAGHPPSRALELLDRLAAGIGGARLATVAALLLDPDTGRLTYSSAGHPPPLLVVPGHPAAYLDGGHGPALAVTSARRRPETTTQLPAGATLVLYTDGLVERRSAGIDVGLARLAAAGTARAAAPLPEFVAGLLADLFGGAGGQDDVAVLAARWTPPQ